MTPQTERMEAALDRIAGEFRHVALAIEVGSRSHGWAHPNSDHDLVVIVQHTTEDYASLSPPEESRAYLDEAGVTITLWDLRRTLQMASRGAVQTLEYMKYEARSRDRFGLAAAIVEAEQDLISVKGAFGAWKNEARKATSALNKAQTAGLVTARNYLVALRPLLMMRAFVRADHERVPFGHIDSLLPAAALPRDVAEIVERLVRDRRAGVIGTLPARLPEIENFIAEQVVALHDLFDRTPAASSGVKARRLTRAQEIFTEMLRLGDAAPSLSQGLDTTSPAL